VHFISNYFAGEKLDFELDSNVCVIGLGYVGLPLALALAESRNVIGVDTNSVRIKELVNGQDRNLQFNRDQLSVDSIQYHSELPIDATVYILTLPTPVDSDNTPDLEPLIAGTRAIGTVLKRGDLVIIESTVYPGVTEEICGPLLESLSGLKVCSEFAIGYSPERINPGDNQHDIRDVTKVVSACCPIALNRVSELYSAFVKPGVFRASSIKVAEAAKVIENTQRDLNIALINELSMLFNKLNINTKDVLQAAGTKWNFHNYQPGLVGGHCIGVDPYYLTYKAQEIGFNTEIILAGRKINDQMPSYVANEFTGALKADPSSQIHILLLGLTFKENCPDFRNSGAVSLANALCAKGLRITAIDPFWNEEPISGLHNSVEIVKFDSNFESNFSGIILAVAHENFRRLESRLHDLCPDGPIMDLKGFFDSPLVNMRL
jgi:UDP-N-acetyl-D-galactosamine dehydrogenase